MSGRPRRGHCSTDHRRLPLAAFLLSGGAKNAVTHPPALGARFSLRRPSSQVSPRDQNVSLHLPISLLAMPDGSSRSSKRVKSTFNTLEREKNFKNPPKDAAVVPILNEFVTPHIESFNALFDDSGLPTGDGDGKGLFHLGLEDIGKRVVFDGKGDIGTESGQRGWGNRLSSELLFQWK